MSLTLRSFKSTNSFAHLNYLRRMQLLVATLFFPLMLSAHAAPQDLSQSDSSRAEALLSRVGTPSPEAVDEFKKAGMEDVKPHALTARERGKVEAALVSLPALNRLMLQKRLHSLAFVDGIPGEGTGLTSPVADTGLYDITLRASILDESLSTFLTTKEHRVFTDDDSGRTVTVEGTGTDAVTYVLLHESTHVMDKSCGITADPHSKFAAGIWVGKAMAPALASSAAATTYFRGGHKLGVGEAANVYDSLTETPFVSLYATASREEDFAELVAWHEILKQHHGDLVIELKDDRGNTLRRWRPLEFRKVKKRFTDVDDLLASQASCSSLS